MKHGGWWKVDKFDDITGSVAIQFGNRTYIKSLDNGTFTLGPPHDEGKPFLYTNWWWNSNILLVNTGDGPDPEEIFTALRINDEHVAFKSGYGKYLKVEKDGVITGRSDAISALQQFEPVFEVSLLFWK